MTAGKCSTSTVRCVARVCTQLCIPTLAPSASHSHASRTLTLFLSQYPQFTTEWAIPYENTQACLRELHGWLEREHHDPHGLRPHFPLEIRFSDADDIWLSPSYGQRTTWIGIIQYKCVHFLPWLAPDRTTDPFRRPYGLNVPYRALFARFEAILIRHGGRPHWAKSHPLRATELRALYPRFDDFVRVLQGVDSEGVWRNEYVERHLLEKEIDGRVFKRRK